MTNPYHDKVDDRLRGREVRASNHDLTLEGWVERINHHNRSVLLRDASDPVSGTHHGSAVVANADSIVQVESETCIDKIVLEAIEPSPYHAAEFSEDGNESFVQDVRDTGYAGSFPVVRQTGSSYEIVEGHKRIWACRQAGLSMHPVEIIQMDDWQAACRFAVDHLPDQGIVDGDQRYGFYDDAATRQAVEALVDEWDERALEIGRVAFNARRLGAVLDLPVEDLDGFEVADEEDVDEDEEPVEDVGEATNDERDGQERADESGEAEDGPDNATLVAEWVEENVNGNATTTTTTEIADDLDIDARGIHWNLKGLDGYVAEKEKTDGREPNDWVITPVDTDQTEAAEDQTGGGSDETGDEDDETAEAVDEAADDAVCGGNEVAEDEPDEDADLVTIASATNQKSNYHRDEECPYVQNMDGPVEKPLDVIPNHDPCGTCCPEAEGPGGDVPEHPEDDSTSSDGYPDLEEREELWAEIAEWALEKIPSVDGGTLAISGDDIAGQFPIDPQNGQVLRIFRRAKGIKVIERQNGDGMKSTEYVIGRKDGVSDVEAATLAGEQYDADDFDIPAGDVEEAAEDAETVKDLADELGCGSNKALQLLGAHDLEHLILGSDTDAPTPEVAD